jgi:hypothetical protein
MARKKTHGDEILELNRKLLTERYPYMDNEFSRLCLHILVGQLPGVKKLRYTIGGSPLDLRVHGTVLSPSGTNKGAIFNFMNKICEALNARGIHMLLKIMGKFTDSALVGTPNTKNVKRDMEDDEGEPIYDGDGKVKKVSEKVPDHTYGALYPDPEHPESHNSILAWSEGSQVLDVQMVNLNQSTMNVLQQCMNPMGTADNIVSKSTGLGEIHFNPDCSIFLVTYRPYTINQKVTSTGFLQRQIVIIREPTAEEAAAVAASASMNLETPARKLTDIEGLVEKLSKVNEFAELLSDSPVGETFVVPDDVKEYLQHKQSMMHNNIKYSNILVRQKLGEFVRRWSVNIFYNLMFHHALINLRAHVELRDVDYASNLISPIWKDFSAFLENALLLDKKETEAISKQYSFIVMTYKRLWQDEERRRAELPPDLQDMYVSWKEYIPRHVLTARLARDLVRSPDAIEELMKQVESSLFLTKNRAQNELNPYDDDAVQEPWVRLNPEASNVIYTNAH